MSSIQLNSTQLESITMRIHLMTFSAVKLFPFLSVYYLLFEIGALPFAILWLWVCMRTRWLNWADKVLTVNRKTIGAKINHLSTPTSIPLNTS